MHALSLGAVLALGALEEVDETFDILDQQPTAEGQLVFVGSSMGGYVVARAAEQCPKSDRLLVSE